MRSSDGTTVSGRDGATAPAQPTARARPAMVLVAAVVLAAEAAGLFAATVLNVVDVATGQTYQASNGVALIVLEVIVIGGMAWIASGLARVRPWTRTPSVMIQVCVGVVAVILLQAHRYEWGVPALLLAIAGLAGLLAPASLRALNRRW